MGDDLRRQTAIRERAAAVGGGVPPGRVDTAAVAATALAALGRHD
jgi:hypothetical protein